MSVKQIAIIIAGLAAAPAIAAPCPAGDPPALPAPFSGWQRPADLTAGASAAAATALPLDRATLVTLAPTPRVTPAMKPGRGPRPESFGGLVAIDVPAAGRYRLAMGNFAWIDMIEDGQSLPSKERDHSLPCVSKILDFELKAGRHVVQIADSKDASTRMMLVAGSKPPAPPRPAAAPAGSAGTAPPRP